MYEQLTKLAKPRLPGSLDHDIHYIHKIKLPNIFLISTKMAVVLGPCPCLIIGLNVFEISQSNVYKGRAQT